MTGMSTSDTSLVERIYLIGPSGSGKTTVAAEVASMLGWTWVDTDSLIEQAAGHRIAATFAEEGEAGFRVRENAALGETLLRDHTVIATGGGICGDRDNVSLMRRHGWLVTLAATPETAYRRLERGAEKAGVATEARTADIAATIGEERPMLAGGQPLARLRTLSQQRRHDYLEADEIIVTDDLESAGVAGRIVAGLIGRGLLPPGTEATITTPYTVQVVSRQSYAAVVAWGGLATLGSRLVALGLPRRLHVMADANVARLYEPVVMSVLMSAGFDPLIYRVPSGEGSKSREELGRIYDWLTDRRAERNEAIIALGGGVVGDLAGFAAASYQRGVPLVQVPTSLVAQVDASIGGKVGINHARGKNLIGAFYQPRLVLADPATLLTLPARERTEGWAEVIKHGVALDAGYFETLAAEADALLALEPEPLTRVISHSVSLKASVIEGDERERDGGRRHLLNYGHTIGHAIEVVSGYGAWLHGEAVAVGMLVEARLGQRLGITSPDVVVRLEELLGRYGLPTRADGLSTSALLQACLWDKKVQDGHLRWALPTTLGQATLVGDVADSEVAAALSEVGVDDR
jgi:shikimate kinase/3-dehydroquinate synthase